MRSKIKPKIPPKITKMKHISARGRRWFNPKAQLYSCESRVTRCENHPNILPLFGRLGRSPTHFQECRDDSNPFKPCKVTTWQHNTREVTKTPHVAIVHDNYQRVKPGPSYPSACLPRDTSTSIRGWSTHYPDLHSVGMVGYRPIRWPSKLLSLWDPINHVCTST
jgi:hypothetical protein